MCDSHFTLTAMIHVSTLIILADRFDLDLLGRPEAVPLSRYLSNGGKLKNKNHSLALFL